MKIFRLQIMDMIETKRTAVHSEITEIPLRLLTREILHKQTVLGVLELNALHRASECMSYSTLLPGTRVKLATD